MLKGLSGCIRGAICRRMVAKIIDGKAVAASLREEVGIAVEHLKQQTGNVLGLAVVLVGEDPASQVYVRNKAKQTKEVGMESFEIRLPADIPEQKLLDEVEKLNHDTKVHGILVQLPLPAHIDETKVINAIDVAKDVDGFHVINSGKLATGQGSAMIPCTPMGCMILLRSVVPDLSGKHAVVLGRSNIVGKPMAQLLLNASCTVTICHSRTQNVQEITRQADIIVAAIGRPEMVTSEWMKPGVVIIDVGINRLPPEHEGEKPRLVGDVAYADACGVAAAITPVPGGVGPMTIACLLANTVKAYAAMQQTEIPENLSKQLG